MEEKDYKKQIIKIYASFAFAPVWFIILYVFTWVFPGTFQEQKLIGKISIDLLLVVGIAYVVFLIKFLSSKKNRDCMKYYEKKKKETKKS